MTRESPNVKPDSGWFKRHKDSCMAWIDKHPRQGWWLATIGLTNLALNLLTVVLQIFGS